MDCEFHLQDPTRPDPVYLLEAILDASRGAVSCMGMFAFASRVGVDSLIVDPEIKGFLRKSAMSLVVGIDAVTNREGVDLELILSFIYKRSILLNLSISIDMRLRPYMTLCQESRGGSETRRGSDPL